MKIQLLHTFDPRQKNLENMKIKTLGNPTETWNPLENRNLEILKIKVKIQNDLWFWILTFELDFELEFDWELDSELDS